MEISDILIDSIKHDTEQYVNWLNLIEIEVDQDLFLAGPILSPDYPVWPRYHDNFHYPLGMRKLLSFGFPKIKDSALKNAELFEGNRREYLLLVGKVYEAIMKIVGKFGQIAGDKGVVDIRDTCEAIMQRPPKSFLEACQLYWFSTIFRIGTSAIGRIDQHLSPFYEFDLKRGVIDKDKTRKILSELLFRYEKRGNGKGDTLQNITLGGCSAYGEDQTNDLSYDILMLRIQSNYIEPKINVRLHRNSPARLLDLVAELQFGGTGICTVFNDDAIIEGLKRYGRPLEIASNYCADGCSEIILDGVGETAFRYIDCVKAVEHTLFSGNENVPINKRLQYYSSNQDYVDIKSPVVKGAKTPDFMQMKTFEDFYQAYLNQLKYQVDFVLKEPYTSDEYPMRLFTAATMPNVIEMGCEPYRNPSCYHSYGLFMGSLGTAVNSIAAIKSLVYENRNVTREEIINALRNDFQGQPTLLQICKNAPKFGSDDDYVDNMAVNIASKFASWVREYNDKTGRPILPGLYNHLFHHTAYSVGATPDGRKYGDPVGEHLSPTPGTADKGPTSIVNSVCKINTNEAIFGSTLHLTIPKVSFQGLKSPHYVLKYLTKAFCSKGGCVLNINVLDAERLLEAQKHPERYKDLVVRVWGFSYYFTLLSKELQDHIIFRAKLCQV